VEEEEEEKEPVRAHELYLRCDAAYYGFHDEHDGSLLEFETAKERECKSSILKSSTGKYFR
jgi:hypothetical protein